MKLNTCRTCDIEFLPHHNTQYYCCDEHTPYKNPLRAWNVWRAMHKRCYDPRTNGYENYGGRGITVCNEWKDYKTFITDMGLRPSIKHQLDRIDSNKGYFKENCRWLFQSRNIYEKAKTRKILFKEKENSVTGWAKELGFSPSTMLTRIENWGVERALTQSHGPTGPKRS